MASARKKQDEKNLKTLRELAALPENRYCFDCNQRGPTYVNITIGSFVCTKCSGLLRGLTPPQRVKSISMATFTQEEVESMKNKGNYYCRRTWMALYDGIIPTDGIQDEQKIRDFMVDKYEKKRYYVEPDVSILKNGHNNIINNINNNQRPKLQTNEFKQDINATTYSTATNNRTLSINGIGRPENKNLIRNPKILNGKNDFVADFAHADIFNAANNNNQTKTTNVSSFANFDNNPVFNSATKSEFSIFDLQFTSRGPILNSVPLFPKCYTNRWSMTSNQPLNNQSNNINAQLTQSILQQQQPPQEDKYAALKDLDNALKAQPPVIDWNSTSNNSSIYSTPTSGHSTSFNSPMSQGSSAYCSPSQGQFPTLFQQQSQSPPISNPFNMLSSFWNNDNSNNICSNTIQPNTVINGCASNVNPFRTANQDNFKGNNGFHANFQTTTMDFNQTNGTAALNNAWTPNPFKIGTTSNGHSNNPFL